MVLMIKKKSHQMMKVVEVVEVVVEVVQINLLMKNMKVYLLLKNV
jgi:hypothetical protein